VPWAPCANPGMGGMVMYLVANVLFTPMTIRVLPCYELNGVFAFRKLFHIASFCRNFAL
jgi:hypothetical protein